jgi:DNA polymerase I
MIKIYQWIETLPKDSIHLLMQVHDELVFEIKLEYVDAYKNTIAEIMSSVATLKVPLEVGIGEGSNWGEAH